MIELESSIERTRLIDPSGNAAEQVIEHRTDPLTGSVASINGALGEKAKAFLGTADVALLHDLEEKTRPGCPFCAAAEKGTRFPADFAPEGQIRMGSALAMPNLFSKCAFDSVVIVDAAPTGHVLFPARLSPEALADAIRVAGELVRRGRAKDSALIHHVAGMNFLGPGGSSVPHPHFQVHVRGVPYSGVSRLVRQSEAFLERTGRGYFEALLSEEKKRGSRSIGSTGSVEWIAPYAPAPQKENRGGPPGPPSRGGLTDSAAGGLPPGIGPAVALYPASCKHPPTLPVLSSPQRSLALCLQ